MRLRPSRFALLVSTSLHLPFLPSRPPYAAISRGIRAADGVDLAVAITPPPGRAADRPAPWAVICHGLMAKGRMGGTTQALAAQLQALGAGVVTFDMRGHGESGGRMADATLATGMRDLRAVVAAVQDFRWAALDHLALIGTSYGGGVAILGAETLPGVSAVALRCPLVDPVPLEGNLPRNHPFAALFADAPAHDVLATARRLTMPAAIVHGTADRVIPVGDARALAAAWGAEAVTRPGCTLHEIAGANHQFSAAAHGDESVAVLTAWLAASAWGAQLPHRTQAAVSPSQARVLAEVDAANAALAHDVEARAVAPVRVASRERGHA